MELVDLLALLERVEEGRERAYIDGRGSEPEEMAEDPVHLHDDHADHLAPLRDVDAHELLDGHHVGAVVDERRQVIHAVRQRHDLVPRPVLAQLLEGRVQIADVRNHAGHRLAVQLTQQA